MNFTIDTEFTTIAKKPVVKEAIKEFKAYFTEGDLLRMFAETVGQSMPTEIISCNISAYCSGTALDNDCGFQVEIIARSYLEFVRVLFYMRRESGVYSIRDDAMLLTCERYERVKD